MTPEQEKAKELVNKFTVCLIKKSEPYLNYSLLAKHCALIAVKELKEEQSKYSNYEYGSTIDWAEVEQEIEKLNEG